MSKKKQITIDDISTSEVTPDVIAARCMTYEFAGRKLHPFSKSRQTAAGLIKVSSFIGADSDGIAANLSLDVQKLIWLCWVDDAMINKVYCQSGIGVPLIREWWDKYGATFGSPEWVEAINTYTSIVNDLELGSATVDSTGSGGEDDSLGE